MKEWQVHADVANFNIQSVCAHKRVFFDPDEFCPVLSTSAATIVLRKLGTIVVIELLLQ